MMSDEGFNAIYCSVNLCLHSRLKGEILCADGLEYDLSIEKEGVWGCKQNWNEIMNKIGTEVLEDASIEKLYLDQIMAYVVPVGTRMLIWAVYHEKTIGFSRECGIKALKLDVFTDQGIIDNKKAAEELMKDGGLSIKQKYKLACLYCSDECISELYAQMTREETVILSLSRLGLIKFWSYYLMDEIDKLLGEKNLYQYRLEKAVESGSKAAVEYCLTERPSEDNVVDAAVEAVRLSKKNKAFDWVVFRHYAHSDSWVPSNYYLDILCFLLLKMEVHQQKDFLQKDIHGDQYEKEPIEDATRSRVLECFLKYPYQVHFMKTAELMWEFLPENNYAVLLLRICDKIYVRDKGNIEYGDEKSYDYRALLQEFWKGSPERYKRYVFSNELVTYVAEKLYAFKAAEGLLVKLLTLENFERPDGETIGFIFSCATDEEREDIIDGKLRNICNDLLTKQRFDVLSSFSLNFFSSTEKSTLFTREIFSTDCAQYTFLGFMARSNWDAVKSFTEWGALSEKEVNEFKTKVICSENGKTVLWNLISRDVGFTWEVYYSHVPVASEEFVESEDYMKLADDILKRCLPSEEAIKGYKKELAFSDIGITGCMESLKLDEMPLAEKVINWCLSSREEIGKLKEMLLLQTTDFLSAILKSNEPDNKNDKFEGGKRGRIDNFLAWFLSSEEEVKAFKKNQLFKAAGERIHYNMIKSAEYEEAKKLCTWFSLSAEDVQELKKKVVYYYASEAMLLARVWSVVFQRSDFTIEGIKVILAQCLTDEEVAEFRDEFERKYAGRNMTEAERYVIRIFISAIERLQSERGV